jgi:hypothetical protein
MVAVVRLSWGVPCQDTPLEKALDRKVQKVYRGSMEMRIRDLPEDVHKALKLHAVRKGIRLNDLVVQILAASAEKVMGRGKPS